MTVFVAPAWYRTIGRILTPFFRGAGSPRIGPWPTTPSGPTWIHAASLGELKGVFRLLDAIPYDHPVFLTSATRSGLDALEREAPRHPCSLLPLDSPSVAERFIDSIRPSAAVFFESEAWPCLLALLQARRTPVAFAAMRTSPTSMRRWSRFSRLFRGWTKSVNIAWTDGSSPLGPLQAMGFADVRCGCGLKWAGWQAREPSPDPRYFAAMSIHLRDLPEIVRMLRRNRDRGWLLFPRRLWLRHPLRILTSLAGLRTSDTPDPGTGHVWIAPRFGMARERLGNCAWTWVSDGHDTHEPHMLGTGEVWTGSPPMRVERPTTTSEHVRAEIVEWIIAAKFARRAPRM